MKHVKFPIIKKIVIMLLFLLIIISDSHRTLAATNITDEEVNDCVKQIFENRNKALLSSDLELLQSIYDTDTKYGTWAYEYEVRKMKYLHNWAEKQGVKFIDIKPTLKIRKIRGSDTNLSINLLCSTEYKYIYEDQPEVENNSRIGTYHNLQIINKDGVWIITKEWYKDPFGDSLNLDNIKADSIKNYIISQNSRDFTTLNQRRINAVKYADEFCGAASEEQYGLKYNKKYRDYNPQGGDCANFASQILFEGGKFKKILLGITMVAEQQVPGLMQIALKDI